MIFLDLSDTEFYRLDTIMTIQETGDERDDVWNLHLKLVSGADVHLRYSGSRQIDEVGSLSARQQAEIDLERIQKIIRLAKPMIESGVSRENAMFICDEHFDKLKNLLSLESISAEDIFCMIGSSSASRSRKTQRL